MARSCRVCGFENEDEATLCAQCGKPLGEYGDLRPKDLRAFSGEEKTIWENGELRLTTEAVLIGMDSDAPDVLPLEAINDVRVEEGCVVLRVKYGPDHYCVLEEPERLATLIREQMLRPRYAHRRVDDPT
jgi:ribosomal protein L40E